MTPENPTEKALPCQFCQSHDVYVRKIGTHGESNAVRCRGCGCHGPLRATPADALVSWNTRPPLAVSETPPDSRPSVFGISDSIQSEVPQQTAALANKIVSAFMQWPSVYAVIGVLIDNEPSPDEHPANSAGQGDAVSIARDEGSCLFCGSSEAESQKSRDKVHPYRVVCKSCGNGTAWHGDYRQAWAAWIRRPTETAQQDSGEVVNANDLARAMEPDLFGQDEAKAHRAASPFDVAIMQGSTIATARIVLDRLPPLYAHPTPSIPAERDSGEVERQARELAVYLPKAADEADENGWMQWGADFREAARLLAALTPPKPVDTDTGEG